MNKNLLLVKKGNVQDKLEKFADFGRTANDGVTRLALSEEDRLVRDYFCNYCENLGLVVEVDDMGNIYGTLEGVENKPPIVIGSHLDTVKKGGKFDGALGVIAGLEVIETLIENNITPKIPITVVNFTNEEGARFEPSMMSSGVLAGKFQKTDMMMSKDVNGISFKEALESINYVGSIENRLKDATAFLELHIEQGPVLDHHSISIGVVDCVVGMVCYEIEINGESNHAGTTPMNMRKDALFVANDLISTVQGNLGRLDEQLVFTIGRMNVHPNIHTVIPNKVIFTIEARHKDPQVMKQVEAIIESLANAPTRETATIQISKLWDRDTVWFEPQLRDSVEQSANALHYSHKRVVSGAGHDAQFIASFIPSTMIFVPSINGKSHMENEKTNWDDCEQGVNVLLNTVLTLMEGN
ncbi:Zn-dependent hydrolase [Pseudogracilibacillus auburnensis]|uniref:Zn-dependent hydrolase n=1 Tax=Pseudogracilibacillus auburnensis TaxID=1494959 RepID=UPI001A96C0F8|nr:Zn-dependent hydrolase [Pseudogracilibacillus auburnensis]MBO1002155.1 Zn-dependent hydrolase [Pseudogracilibacillus auburnensis]